MVFEESHPSISFLIILDCFANCKGQGGRSLFLFGPLTLAPWCIVIKMREIEALYAFACFKRCLVLEGFNCLASLMTRCLVFKKLHWFVFNNRSHDIVVLWMWQRVGNRKDIYPVWKEFFFFSNNFEIEILRHFNFLKRWSSQLFKIWNSWIKRHKTQSRLQYQFVWS